MFKEIFVFCIFMQSVMLKDIENAPYLMDVSIPPPAAAPTNFTPEIQEALLYSQVVIKIINDYMITKLPAAMLPQGEMILAETKESLAQCESSLKRNEDIWQYKTCSSAQLRYATTSLGTLTANYYGNNAATHFGRTTAGLFCIFSLFSLYLMK